MSKFLKFFTLDDISFTRSGSQMNLHLANGQIAEVSYDVVKEAYKAMQPLQEPNALNSIDIQVINRIHDGYEVRIHRVDHNWPNGVDNAPVWRTADDRVLPVTEMDDYHISNALRKMGTIIRSYPNTKNIHHYKQWQGWFKQEIERRRGR